MMKNQSKCQQFEMEFHRKLLWALSCLLVFFVNVICEESPNSNREVKNGGSISTTLNTNEFKHYYGYIDVMGKKEHRHLLALHTQMRKKFLDNERDQEFGSELVLNDREKEANYIIMRAKRHEINEDWIAPKTFNPSKHLFSFLDKISISKLFKYLKKMPKGGVLHVHDTVLCSIDFLIKTSYREYLWACQIEGNLNIKAFRFSVNQPAIVSRHNCTWSEMWRARKIYGSNTVDDYLRKQFTIYPREKFEDNNAAWQGFKNIFALESGLLLYHKVWVDYYKNALKEFYDDGVQYLEFRTTLPALYDEHGTSYPQIWTAQLYKCTLTEFMRENPGFVGSKMIYAPSRNVNAAGMEKNIQLAIELKKVLPTFFAGFDLGGQEELGRPLRDLLPQLLQMPDDINFYFHAGEINWFGSSTDENLVDALLLGTKRIDRGFALLKHPLALEYLKKRNIAIEVSPISNQVVPLVSDLRNHPCAYFFANNYPVVISLDDPSFWKASPLSHDFYLTFLGIASAQSDLRMLKQLANNSITYSAMSDSEKSVAFQKWTRDWNYYIMRLVACKDVFCPEF